MEPTRVGSDTFLPVTILAEGRESPGAPSLDTGTPLQASFGYTCSEYGLYLDRATRQVYTKLMVQ